VSYRLKNGFRRNIEDWSSTRVEQRQL